MTYNFITADNGVGLSRDMKIFADALDLKKDIDWFFCDYHSHKKPPKRDINVYFELVDSMYFDTADFHILVPNPEWYLPRWTKLLDRFDLVLCKTHHAVEVFKPYVGGKAIFVGFTSDDRFLNVQKDYTLPACFMGKSMTKGAKPVYDACVLHDKPLLLLSNKLNEKWIKSVGQVVTYRGRLEDDDFMKIQNTQGIHVCCSDYEGFGHYINEAKSTGAVIITTNYPPMNEICSEDFAFFVRAKPNRKQGLVQTCIVDSVDFIRVYNEVVNTDPETLKEMGEKARRSFLINDKGFKARMKKLKKKINLHFGN